MLAADLIRAMAQAGAGSALLTGRASVWVLPASGVVCGAAAALFRACAIGLTPSLVPEPMLGTANGLMTLSRRAAVAVGPVAAAGVIAVGGPGGAYLLDGASFAVSALSIARIAASRRPQPGGPRAEGARGGSVRTGSPPPGFWRSIVDGARSIWAARWVTGSLAVFAVANVALGALYVAGPIVCWQRFGGPEPGPSS